MKKFKLSINCLITILSLSLLIFSGKGYGEDGHDHVETSENLSSSIEHDTHRLTSGFRQNFGHFNNHNNHNRGRRGLSAAEWNLMRIQVERQRWKLKREKIKVIIENRTKIDKIRLIRMRSKRDIMHAQAELEGYRTLLKERKKLRDVKVQKKFSQANLLLLNSKRKLAIMKKFIDKEMKDNSASKAYRALEYCMVNKPLSKSNLLAGYGIDALRIVNRQAKLYSPICTYKRGHHFSEKDIAEIKYNMAVKSKMLDKRGSYFSPLIAFNPVILTSIKGLLLSNSTKRKIVAHKNNLNNHIQDFYSYNSGDFKNRKQSVKKLLAETKNFFNRIKSIQANTNGKNQRLEKLEKKIAKYEAKIESIDEKIDDLDEFDNNEKKVIEKLQKESYKIQRTIIKLRKKATDAALALNLIKNALKSFNSELKLLDRASKNLCQYINDYKNHKTYEINSPWKKVRELIIPCNQFLHPKVFNINNPKSLSNIPNGALCPDRNLLKNYVLNGKIYTFNNFCLAPKLFSNHIYHPSYNSICQVYHQVEGCIVAEGIRSKPNEDNIFDHLAKEKEEYEEYKKEKDDKESDNDDHDDGNDKSKDKPNKDKDD